MKAHSLLFFIIICVAVLICPVFALAATDSSHITIDQAAVQTQTAAADASNLQTPPPVAPPKAPENSIVNDNGLNLVFDDFFERILPRLYNING